MPRPELCHRRCMVTRAGRDTSKTARTVPDIATGSSCSMTHWTVRIELISSPCTAADQRDARSGLRALGDHRRDVGVLARGRLHALEIEQMLLAGLEVLDVEGGDDLLARDHVAGVG